MNQDPSIKTAASRPARGLAYRLLGWAFWVILAVSIVRYIPYEVSYWCLAAAKKNAQEGKLETALKWCEQAAGWTPHAALPHNVRFELLLKAKQPEPALAALEEAIKREPTSPLHEQRINLLVELGRERELIDEVVRLGVSEKAGIEARLRLVRYLTLDGRHDDALKILDDASPEKAEEVSAVRRLRISILQRVERFDEALVELDKEIESKPSLPLRIQRIDLLMQLDRPDEVQKACDELEASLSLLERQLSAVNNMLAYARAVVGRDLEKAEANAEHAVRLSAGLDPAILDTRGYVYFLRGKHEAALEDLNQAVEASSRALESVQAQASQTTGTFQELEAKEQRQQLQKALAVMLYHRSLVHDALGNEDDAVADRAHVRELGFEPNERLF